MFTTVAWCSSRSRMAVATTSSANTWPQSPKPRLEVSTIEPRSYQRDTTWKIQWADAASMGR
jgi:hypothetical protein